jgi:putative ABC transport system ATP-binding protein
MRVQNSAASVLRRGVGLSAALTKGLGWTLLLAVAAVGGRLILPVTIQLVIDHLLTSPTPIVNDVGRLVLLAAGGVVLTAIAGYIMNVRLAISSETGLAETRVKVFGHIHNLAMLRLRIEQRGALVSRVTGDVDTLTAFVQSNGLTLLMSLLQVSLTTVVMVVYSWQLTFVVWICFLTVFLALRRAQPRMASLFGAIRERVAAMMAHVSEALAGLVVLATPRMREHAAARTVASVDDLLDSQLRAQRLTTATLSLGEVITGVVNLAIVIVGAAMIAGGQLTAGELTAILFLATLFVGPAQMGVEMLAETQNALATWRRILDVADIDDRLTHGRTELSSLRRGAASLRFEQADFAYPDGDTVLRCVDVEIAAGSRVVVVGQTGAGKSTFGHLAVRLADPTSGRVLLDGTDITELSHAALRRRTVMVPQDGFLFNASVADNVRYGAPDLTDRQVEEVFADLGLHDWITSLLDGVATPVGPRGEALSSGERQLVAIARAHAAAPDLLVLDEATSSVDPQMDLRIQQAFDRLARGRTSIVIAHRLSAALTADCVLVFDQGRLAETGTHDELLRRNEIYARLYGAWINRVITTAP